MKKARRIAICSAVVLLPMLFAGMIAAQDVGNWTRQIPSRSPSPRGGHAMAYDSAHGQVVLFGGYDDPRGLRYLGDTWTWDGSNWIQKFPRNSPPAQFGHAMAYDSAHGQVVLFGGPANGTWGVGRSQLDAEVAAKQSYRLGAHGL